LHLKRFEYDFQRDALVKINDRYEFPAVLDLDIESRKYSTKGDGHDHVRNVYHLHSVLVHSGGIHGGHYYAYIRPMLGEQWYKFDDERVTKEPVKRAIEDQFGGDEQVGFMITSLALTMNKARIVVMESIMMSRNKWYKFDDAKPVN
jgi:ubiquitin carboxyl-terminal hydrolase 7